MKDSVQPISKAKDGPAKMLKPTGVSAGVSPSDSNKGISK